MYFSIFTEKLIMSPYIYCIPVVGPLLQIYHTYTEKKGMEKIDSNDFVQLDRKIHAVKKLNVHDGNILAGHVVLSLFVTVHAIALIRFTKWPLALASLCVGS